MKKFFLPLLFIAAAATVNAQSTTATTTVANPNGPLMKFDVMEHQFGTIKQGEVATYEFKFKNAGKEPLVISTAVGSCGCTVPDWPKEPIAPGKSAVIKVTFNSTGKMGIIDKTVTITSNNRDGQVVLHMKGEVKTADQVQPGTGTGTSVGGGTTTTNTGTGSSVSDGKTTVTATPADSKTSTSSVETKTVTKSKASKNKKSKSGGQ